MNEYLRNQASGLGSIFGGAGQQSLAALLERAEQMPLADPDRIAAELEKPLYLLRRADLSVARRFQSLELLVKPVSALVCSINALVGTSPLSVDARRLIFTTDALLTEYLAGYLQCLRTERTAGLFNHWRYRGIWPTCAHRAITLIGLIAETGRMVNRPATPGFWMEIWRTYKRAVEAGWIATEVPGLRAPGNATTVEWEYRRILLLTQIHPRLLDIRSSREVAALLNRCVAGLEPAAPRNGRAPIGFVGFGILKGFDLPPKPLRSEFASRDKPHWEYLHNAERLMAELAILINRAEASEHQQVTLAEGSIRLGTLLLLWRNWFGAEPHASSIATDVTKLVSVGSQLDAAQEVLTAKTAPQLHPASSDESRFGSGVPGIKEWESRIKRLERVLDEEGSFNPLGRTSFGGATQAIRAQAVLAP